MMKNFKYENGMIQVRIQADDSYQIKRAIDAVGKEKGFVLMSRSGIKKNSGEGPKLREFASFRDLKAEKRQRKDKNINQQQ
jgi:hypothetical protein